MRGVELRINLNQELLTRLDRIAARRSLKRNDLLRVALSSWIARAEVEEQERQGLVNGIIPSRDWVSG